MSLKVDKPLVGGTHPNIIRRRKGPGKRDKKEMEKLNSNYKLRRNGFKIKSLAFNI